MSAKHNSGFRPALETLEDRCLLSGGLSVTRHAAPEAKRRRPRHVPGHHRVHHPRLLVNYGLTNASPVVAAPVVPPVPAPPVDPAPAPAPGDPTPAPIFDVSAAPANLRGSLTPTPAPAQSAIPNMAVYQVTITGVADGVQFTRTGALVVAGTINDPTSTSGRNGREVLLLSGNPSANPQAGSIWFGTNRLLFSLVPGLSDLGAPSALDLAYVSTDEQGGHLTIDVDRNRAGLAVMNQFNTQSGVLANVYETTAARIQLDFQNGGQRLTGSVAMVGSGYIYPSSTAYLATITGTRVA